MNDRCSHATVACEKSTWNRCASSDTAPQHAAASLPSVCVGLENRQMRDPAGLFSDFYEDEYGISMRTNMAAGRNFIFMIAPPCHRPTKEYATKCDQPDTKRGRAPNVS